MITLITIGSIIYCVLSIWAGMVIGEFCRRRFRWDEIGVAMVMMCIFIAIPITVAADLGVIR
jgi:hypothetical protein